MVVGLNSVDKQLPEKRQPSRLLHAPFALGVVWNCLVVICLFLTFPTELVLQRVTASIAKHAAAYTVRLRTMDME
jgi:hypothetical protein